MKRFFLLVLLFSDLFSKTLTKTVSFSQGEVTLSTHQGYKVIELREGFIIPDPGKPALPVVNRTFVIPADARLSDVSVEPVATQKLPGKFNIFPAQPAVPISNKQPLPFVPPDPAIYFSDNPFPCQPLVHYSTGSAGGFKLVAVTFTPFKFHPNSGELFFHNKVRIVINYEEKAIPPSLLTPLQRERVINSLTPLVANPEQILSFAPLIKKAQEPQIDYLVITNQKLASFFTPYIKYRTSRGIKTEIRTTEWIERNYTGRDLQEKIRNLIRDYFQNRGLSYVLLAGDNQEVPSRRIRLEIPEVWDIPSDLYYGDLDYSWDSNHNNLFGEMVDSVDFYADVFVGRVSVEDSIQVCNFIAKVQSYENEPANDYIKRALLPSGWLWRSLGYHGKFVNDSIANQTPPDWIDRKMENPPNAGVVADSFDNGFALFDPAGHGNEWGVYDEDGTPIYTSAVAGNQHNDRRFTIVTSLACNPGNFEAEDCLAEVALNCPQGGAIGVMMNSRYGWGTPPYIGPSELLCIRFYDFLFNYHQSVIGIAHNRSREEYVGSARWNVTWRWCLTEFNLLGDPTIDIWTEVPTTLTIIAPESVFTGSQTLPVTVEEEGNPAVGVLITAYKDNEVFARGITNASGQINLNIHPLTPGEIKLTAARHNSLPKEKRILVKQGASEPVLTYRGYEIDDHAQFNPNRILEPGETAYLKLLFYNIGLAPATNATVTLRTLNPDILILDSTATIGTVGPNDSAQAEHLIISARPSILPGSNPEMFALVRSDQGEFWFWFSIQLGYPGRTWANVDTGVCALTVTARGSIGFDISTKREGKGFRYPKSETTGLNLASFALGNSENYLVDRFYNQTPGGFDQDWWLQESLRVRLPLWNEDELIKSSFTDQGHPDAKGLVVEQRALGLAKPGLNNFVILIYDIKNPTNETIFGLYAGILADFDVKINDRFHDLTFTIPALNATMMYNILFHDRYFGVKLLYPQTPAKLTCIDHSRYVYPDSALTDNMKFRILKGELGVGHSDRPYNWGVSVATGPFNLLPNETKRVAFAFIAAFDSLSFISACSASQDWFNTNLGVEDKMVSTSNPLTPGISISPNIFTRRTTIRYSIPYTTPFRLNLVDITGRKVATIIDHNQPAGSYEFNWQPKSLAPGVYFLRLETPFSQLTERVLFVR